MKKKLAVLLALAMSVVSFGACGKEAATTESTSAGLDVFKPSVELVAVEGDVIDLTQLPVEEYVTVGEYKGLTIEVAPKQEVTAEAVETEMMYYYYSQGTTYLTAADFVTEGTVENTDIVLIDFEGKKDGVAFDGGSATDHILGIGSESFIDGFESGLVGVKAGETVDLNLTFPEDYGSEDLAGADVVFKVKVNEIKEKQTRELDEDFFEDLGMEGIDSEEKLREEISILQKSEKIIEAITNASRLIYEEDYNENSALDKLKLSKKPFYNT